MTSPRRASLSIGRAVAPCLLALCLVAACVAAPAGAQEVVHYQHESFPAFEGQLNAGQIESATFNKKAHTLHLGLKDGRHVLVSYPSHEEPQLAAKLRAKGVAVHVQKKKKATKAVHHKLRYIAGGILIVVIIVVLVVLLIDRRRKLGEAAAGGAPPGEAAGGAHGSEAPGGGAQTPSSPGDSV
jgi:ATP-dependent Zn protease